MSTTDLRSFFISFLFIVSAIAVFSCGSSIRDAQEFIPNKAPVMSTFTVTYIGTDTEYNSKRLYSGMPFLVTVDAYDPEGGQLTYDLTSSQGIFSSPVITNTGISRKFYIGTIAGGDSVAITLVIKDSKSASYTQTIDVGTGKTGPGLTVIPPTSSVISPGGDTTMSFSCDSMGTFRVYRDNSVTSSDNVLLGTEGLSKYTTENETKTYTITGPSSIKNGVSLVDKEKNYVWIVFEDNNSQKAVAVMNMYVEGTNPRVVSTAPADRDTYINVTPAVSILFSKAMNASTINSTNITMSAAGGSSVSGIVSYDTELRTAVFTPSTTLMYDATYTVKVLSSVADTVGNLMVDNTSFSFRTVAKDTVPSPGFTPIAGIYTGTKNVTISCSDESATILYTIDGTVPIVTKNSDGTFTKGNGLVYSGSVISVSGNQTIRALAYKDYYTASIVSAAAYSIKVAPPSFNFTQTAAQISAGTGAGTLEITGSGSIWYSVDGSDPSGTGGNLLGTGQLITIDRNMTVRAIAKQTGMTNSDETSQSWNVRATTPTFSIETGLTLNADTSLSMYCDSGALIYYTLTSDGSTPDDPTTESNPYAWGIPLLGQSGTQVTYTIKAIAVKSGMENSAVSNVMTYTVDFGSVGAISFDHTAATYDAELLVKVSCATADATVQCTTSVDGTTILATYTGFGSVSVPVTKTLILNATASKGSMTPMTSGNKQYTLVVPNPVINGTFDSGAGVIRYYLTSTNAEKIYYTTNGDAPTPSSGTFISGSAGSISVIPGMIVRAIGYRSGWSVSSEASVTHYCVMYNGNGYTGGSEPVDSTLYLAGESVTVKANSMTRTSCIFNGWNTAIDGSGISRTAGIAYTASNLAPTGVITLYAQWKSSLAMITGFVFTKALNPGLTSDYYCTITGMNISGSLPSTVSRSNLIPTIVISPGATVSPASDTVADFSAAKTYTVTAADGTTIGIYSVSISSSTSGSLTTKTICSTVGQSTISITANCTAIAKVWGAGGGTNSENTQNQGGGGGYSYSVFTASASDILYVMVGYGGNSSDAPSSGYPALGGLKVVGDVYSGGGGGGGSVVALYRSPTYTLKCCGGGGGGGSATGPYNGIMNGGAGGGSSGETKSYAHYDSLFKEWTTYIVNGGSGGIGGVCTPTLSSRAAGLIGYTSASSFALLGGNGATEGYIYSGSGGGGYGGGGAGENVYSVFMGGGGGGGYAVDGTTDKTSSWSVAGSGATPGNTADVDYIAGVGVGGSNKGNGGNGLVVIYLVY